MVAALAALTFPLPAIATQDAGEAHPAHIHAGTCAELGDVVAPLSDVVAAEGAWSGPESAIPVQFSESTVDLPLEEIIAGGHAINVHLSAEEIDTYIACGDIGGVVRTPDTEDDLPQELLIGLGELNDSGYVGYAFLGAVGETTTVTVVLGKSG
jgi:hypothetical protein